MDRLRVAGLTGNLQAREVGGPAGLVFRAEPVQKIPGKNAGVVAVGKSQADGVVADWLDGGDADLAFAGDEFFLRLAVALDFGAGAFDAQKFGREVVGDPV